MTKRTVVEIVLIFFGIECVLQFFLSLTLAFLQSFVHIPPGVASKPLYIAWSFLAVLVPLILAYILLLKRRLLLDWLAPADAESPPRTEADPVYARLSFWIQIIGVYHLIGSVSACLARVPSILGDGGLTSLWTNWLLHNDMLVVVFSLLCIFKARQIEGFIRRRSESEDTQPAHAAD